MKLSKELSENKRTEIIKTTRDKVLSLYQILCKEKMHSLEDKTLDFSNVKINLNNYSYNGYCDNSFSIPLYKGVTLPILTNLQLCINTLCLESPLNIYSTAKLTDFEFRFSSDELNRLLKDYNLIQANINIQVNKMLNSVKLGCDVNDIKDLLRSLLSLTNRISIESTNWKPYGGKTVLGSIVQITDEEIILDNSQSISLFEEGWVLDNIQYIPNNDYQIKIDILS